jgi:hypothetical protein
MGRSAAADGDQAGFPGRPQSHAGLALVFPDIARRATAGGLPACLAGGVPRRTDGRRRACGNGTERAVAAGRHPGRSGAGSGRPARRSRSIRIVRAGSTDPRETPVLMSSLPFASIGSGAPAFSVRRLVFTIGSAFPIAHKTHYYLRGLPGGSYAVRVIATTRSGRRIVRTRHYRTCASAAHTGAQA